MERHNNLDIHCDSPGHFIFGQGWSRYPIGSA
jgi:hypothetical protein